MRSLGTRGAFLFALVFALATAGTSAASGSSLGGVRGLLHVQSADPSPAGYFAGTLWGSYERAQYVPSESPRARAETVKFGETALSVVYAPAALVELALHGTAEGQFLRSEAADVSTSELGFREVGLGIRAVLTPASRRDFGVAAGLDVSTTTGATNALAGSWDADGFDITGRLGLTYTYRAAGERPALRAHLNTGWLNRTGEFDELAWAITAAGPTPSTSVLHGDQFLYGAGLEIPAPSGWTVFAEWSGEYDVDASADFGDNPMRITPGVRWAAPGGAFAWTSGVDVSLASEEAGPPWQLIAGMTFGGHVSQVSGMLRGVVRDAETGEPIAGARIAPRSSGKESVTDAEGRFRADLDEGYAVLEVSADGYVSKTRVVEIPAHREVEFDFTLPKRNIYGQLRGHLYDAETGRPVAGRVRAQGGEWVDSDPDTGTWELPKVAQGNVVLEFESARHHATTAELRVVAGEESAYDASLVPDPQAAFALVTGEVLDAESGRPVAGTVTARGRTSTTAIVDPATGRYELRLEAGEYSLSAAGRGYATRIETASLGPRSTNRMDWSLSTIPPQLTLHGVQFDSGASTIKRESFTAIEEAARFLNENPGIRVVIEGHTDDAGTPEGNLSLSQRRADAVMKYLVVNYGVDPSRVMAKGLGADRPIAPNDTEENRARNRRIELVVQEQTTD